MIKYSEAKYLSPKLFNRFEYVLLKIRPVLLGRLKTAVYVGLEDTRSE